MISSDSALATFYKLSLVTMSPSAAIFDGMFQALSGRISEYGER